MDPVYFDSPAELDRWLEANHASARELWIGFYKGDARRLTYSQALDAALCWGWIDGVRKSVDPERWTIRFTPRKPRSVWSKVNIARARELIGSGAMRQPGLAAFEARTEDRSEIYSYEQAAEVVDSAELAPLRANANAWTFFQAQPPYYRRMAAWWIVSAKKPETRQRRVAQLIDACSRATRLFQLTGGTKPPADAE